MVFFSVLAQLFFFVLHVLLAALAYRFAAKWVIKQDLMYDEALKIVVIPGAVQAALGLLSTIVFSTGFHSSPSMVISFCIFPIYLLLLSWVGSTKLQLGFDKGLLLAAATIGILIAASIVIAIPFGIVVAIIVALA